MSRNATIALVQMDCVMLDKEANLQKAKTFIEQAAQQHADLICFPEMFSTGYSPALIGPKYIDVAEEPDGPTFCFLAELAKKYSMYIVAPIVLKSEIPGLLYNGLIVISRNGQLMGTYNKTHLWAGERFWFRAGDRYPVFHMDFGTVGLMICYDGGFPEVSRILALSGAELILCPSAFPIRDKDIPNIIIRKTKPLGHYGRLRKAYLEMHRPILFNELVLSDKLFEHCAEIDETARNRMELIVRSLAEQNGVTEQLKAENQMEWVRQMNACKAQAEEIVKVELIYD